MLVLLLLLISRLINRSGLRLSHSKVFSSDDFYWEQASQQTHKIEIKYCFQVVEGRQEDAEEFLTCLLNGTSDEMQTLIKQVVQVYRGVYL